MEAQTVDTTISSLLMTLQKGQYLLFVEALRQAGGEVRINPREFVADAMEPMPKVAVETMGTAVCIHISG